MELLLSVTLGVVQGLTEFLPVSSTGHLILVRELFGVENAGSALAFDAVLQLATMGAVIVYFWKDILNLCHTAFRLMGRLPVDRRDRTLIFAIALGTLPALACGLLLEDFMETTFRSPLVVAGVLVAGSALFAYAEYAYLRHDGREQLSIPSGFKVGLFQALALIPGMSRSGATISGGLIFGFSRYEATRFAFLLAIPILSGAGIKKLLELVSTENIESLVPLLVGAVVSFVVGLGAIHFMLRFMRTNTLWPFIWYRLLLAVFVVALVFLG